MVLLLLYRVTFTLNSSYFTLFCCEILHVRMMQYTVRMTRIQHIGCVTKKITIRFQCTYPGMKCICIGNTKVLNMFKTFMLACQSYTDEKNTIQIDCHCHCHCQNDPPTKHESCQMVNSSSFSSKFCTVRMGSGSSFNKQFTACLLWIKTKQDGL